MKQEYKTYIAIEKFEDSQSLTLLPVAYERMEKWCETEQIDHLEFLSMIAEEYARDRSAFAGRIFQERNEFKLRYLPGEFEDDDFRDLSIKDMLFSFLVLSKTDPRP